MTGDTGSNAPVRLADIERLKIADHQSVVGSSTWWSLGVAASSVTSASLIFNPSNRSANIALRVLGITTAIGSLFAFLKAHRVEEIEAQQQRVDEAVTIMKVVAENPDPSHWQKSLDALQDRASQKQR